MVDAHEKSFINTIKKRGPRIEPWGTPCVINFVSDLLLLYITNLMHSILCSICRRKAPSPIEKNHGKTSCHSNVNAVIATTILYTQFMQYIL